MKLELIAMHEEALRSLATLPLTDAQTAWNLSEALEETGKHLDRYNEKRNELIKKHGKQTEGDQYFVSEENMAAFNKELEELLSVDVKVKFPTLKIDQLNGAAVSAADLIAWRKLGIISK